MRARRSAAVQPSFLPSQAGRADARHRRQRQRQDHTAAHALWIDARRRGRGALERLDHSGIGRRLSQPARLRRSPQRDPTRIQETLERLGLAPYRHFPSKVLSQGQKRRLALARLAILRKSLWILDEPLRALDVNSVGLMTEILMEHLARDGLIIMTSHQEIGVETKTMLPLQLDSRAGFP